MDARKRKVPTRERRVFELAVLAARDADPPSVIDRICGAWDAAVDQERARGFARQSPGPRAAAGIIRPDPNDPLHARQMPGASSTGAAFGDTTGNQAIQADYAGVWLDEAQRCLLLLLRVSPADERPERRRTGPFHPPSLRETLRRAAQDVVELWPVNIELLIERLHRLADSAAVRWPPRPRAGQTIETPEGPVTVLKKGNPVEMCNECRGPVVGNAGDPIRRLDGRPYHARPCYETVRKRKQRRSDVPPGA